MLLFTHPKPWLKWTQFYFATIISILVLSFSYSNVSGQVGPGIAPVNPPAGGFQIEGNLQANTPVAGKGDWLPGPAGAGGYVLTSAGVPLDTATTFHLIDVYHIPENNFGGGYKFNDNPNSWKWVTNTTTAKCDINNALFHLTAAPYMDPITHQQSVHTWLILAADRRVNTGNAYIDFELYQNSMKDNSDGSFTSAGTQGGRTVNDLLLTLALTNGGGASDFYVHRWQQVAPNTYDYVDKTSTIPAGTVFASTNAGVVPVSFDAFGTHEYAPNLFVEAAIDLTALIAAAIDPCTSLGIKTIFVKTKTSQSPTATLVDFISARQVSLKIGGANAGPDTAQCSNVFTVTGSATPSPGDAISSVTWSVVPASGTANIASPNALSTSVTVTSTSVKLALAIVTTRGCTLKDTVMLTVKPSPTVNVNSPAICYGDTATLTATHNAQSPTFSWSPGAATTSSIKVAPVTTTQYTVTVTDGVSGCSGQGSGTVTVKPLPGAPTVGVVNNCNNTSTLTASNYTGTLLWSTGQTINPITVGAPGTYTVTQTVNGCTSANGSGVAAPKTTPGAPTVAVVNNCNETSTLTASNFTGSLLWSTGETTAVITVATPGSYTVTQTVNGCTSTTGTGIATPKSTPAAPTVTYNAPACNETTFSVTIGNVISGVIYTITDKNGNTIAGVNPTSPYTALNNNNFSFSNIPAGSGYQVTATVAGCPSGANACGVTSIGVMSQSKVLTANVEEVTKVTAYPNPFTDVVKFRLETSVAGQASLDLYNIMGQKIKTPFQGYMRKGEVRTIELNLPNYPQANLIYVFRIGNEKVTGKLLKL